MRGVILAGGLGTRLRPLTTVINKHLLPVHDKPMLFYPLEMMAEAGIEEVLIVVGGQSTEEIMKLCKDGKQFGFKRLYYVYQDGEGGIAHALSLAEEFTGEADVCVILGDNLLLGDDMRKYREKFESTGYGAMVIVKTVPDPQNYGVPLIDKEKGRLLYISEKPEKPQSKYGVIGIYFYDSSVYEVIRQLHPSKRGELEITDVNNVYAESGDIGWMEAKGKWVDCGSSIPAWMEANEMVKAWKANHKEVVIEA